MPSRFFATCARGLEAVLADELKELPAGEVEVGRGGVAFTGDQSTLYRANLWLRTAIRVLQPIAEFRVTTPEELYDAVKAIDWSQYLSPDHTLAVDCNIRDSHLTHSKYAALKTKDAICDQFVEKHGRRPSVDVAEPMVGLNLHVFKDNAVLSLDSSGASLHKRGYRPILTRAPLNESLAAGLVLLAGWRGNAPFVDPLCGSGTLCIEAAWTALHRPPGLTRRRFGFMGWLDFDIALWTAVRDEARRGVMKKLDYPVLGFDLRNDAIRFAQTNARAAGIGHVLSFQQKDVRDFHAPDGTPGTIMCNPPYGERLGEEKDLRGLYQTLGEVFRTRCQGWKKFVFSGNARLARFIGLEAIRHIELFNGKIPCRLLEFA